MGTGRAPAGILPTRLLYLHLFGECFLAHFQSKTASLPRSDSQINNAAFIKYADISFHSHLFLV